MQAGWRDAMHGPHPARARGMAMRARTKAPTLLLFALAACGSADAGEGKSSDFPNGAADGGTSVPGSGSGGGDNDEEASGDLSFQSPQAGLRKIFVPNPTTHRVAVVDAETYRVETFASGITPRAACVLRGSDDALVVNEGSRDVSWLTAGGEGTELTRIPVGHPINAIAAADDRRHALVYYASSGASGADTHQDASVIGLAGGTPRVWAISVGFRPRAVSFSSDGQFAFVVSEDGISRVHLDDGDDALRVDQYSLGSALTTGVADVQVTPDGSYAIARTEGRAELTLLNLADGSISTLDLASLQVPQPADAGLGDAGAADASVADASVADGGAALLPSGALELTDLDLAPDGASAYVMLRSHAILLKLPIPAAFAAPRQIVRVDAGLPGVGALRVSPDGTLGVLYSTAVQLPALLLADLTDLAAGELRPLRLRKAVRAVAIAPDAAHLFVLHTGALSGGSAGDAFAAAEGFSLVSVADGFAKFEPTDVPVREGDVVATADGARLFSLVRGASAGAVLSSDLATLRTTSVPLARPPSSLGLVPGVGRLFVGQDGSGGMITFLDADSGSIERTLSGFELASKVRQ
jgi:hypothetical protein